MALTPDLLEASLHGRPAPRGKKDRLARSALGRSLGTIEPDDDAGSR